jgi:hypothetical protein
MAEWVDIARRIIINANAEKASGTKSISKSIKKNARGKMFDGYDVECHLGVHRYYLKKIENNHEVHVCYNCSKTILIPIPWNGIDRRRKDVKSNHRRKSDSEDTQRAEKNELEAQAKKMSFLQGSDK